MMKVQVVSRKRVTAQLKTGREGYTTHLLTPSQPQRINSVHQSRTVEYKGIRSIVWFKIVQLSRPQTISVLLRSLFLAAGKSNPLLLWRAKHLLRIDFPFQLILTLGEGERDVLEERWLSDGV